MAPAGKIIWDTPTNALWRMEQRGLPWPAAHKLLLQWLAAGDVMLASRGRPVPPAHIAGAAFDHNDLALAALLSRHPRRLDHGARGRPPPRSAVAAEGLAVKPEPEPEPKPERATQVVRATQRCRGLQQADQPERNAFARSSRSTSVTAPRCAPDGRPKEFVS